MNSLELILANSLKKGLEKVDIEIAVSNVSSDMAEFDVTLTMKAGVSYCCMEYGCFVPTASRELYADLHESLTAPPVTIRSLRVVVEKGAVVTGQVMEAKEYTVGPFREADAR
jgi:hypothetical protein